MPAPVQRHRYTDATLQRQTAALLTSVTGLPVSLEWASKVILRILEGKNPADPWRYIRGAILGSGDPNYEFLPISAPGYH
jgi:hypothetical protein